MLPYQWTMLGLILNIPGAFLVAVEAIKPHNLRKLRDKVFGPVHRTVLPIQITFVDRELTNLERQQARRAWAWFFLSHFLAGLAGIFAVAFALQRFGLDVWSPMSSLLGGLSTKAILLLAVPVFLVMALTVLAIGEAIHVATIWLSKMPIAALDLIERKTPDGTIGIVGFLLLLVGFVMQIYGSWAGRGT